MSNNSKYIFTVTAGRSGQETLYSILDRSINNSYVSFEAPSINTFFKGSLSSIEHRIRRKYFETHELLGRGKVLSAYNENNISFINNIASKRIENINNRLISDNKSIYIDVSKYFIRGLHIGFCNILPGISLINLVRDPIKNMKSFMNRNKNFLLDNNLPESDSNILQLDSLNMTKEELYLWSWFEVYLRFQKLKKKDCVDSYTEIFTEKLDDGLYISNSLKSIGLDYNHETHFKKKLNTNTGKGYAKTHIYNKDIDIYYNFLKKVPLKIIKEISYLDSYDPEIHIV